MTIFRKWRNYRQKPPFGAEIDCSDPITHGLCYCLLANEFYGSVLHDESQFRHRCVLMGASWKAGNLLFDGADDYAYTPHNDILSLGGAAPATWEMLFIQTKDGAPERLLAKEDRANGKVRYYLSTRADIDYSIRFASYTNYTWYTLSSSVNALKIGEIIHVVFTYDLSNLKVYVNGKLDNVTAFSPSYFPADSARNLWIGYDPYYLPYFGGTIHHIRLWNGKCLSDDEILRLHEEPYSFFLTPAPWFMIDLGAVTTTYKGFWIHGLSDAISIETETNTVSGSWDSGKPIASINYAVPSLYINLFGNINALSTTNANILLDIILEGLLSNNTTINIDLDIDHTITGNIFNSSSVSTKLDIIRQVISQIQTNSDISGLVNILFNFSGGSNITTEINGFTKVLRDITAGTNVISSIDGYTNIDHSIIANINNISGITSTIDVTRTFFGDILPQSTINGLISQTLLLKSLSAAVSNVLGDILITTAGVVYIDGNVAGNTSLSGYIQLLRSIYGNIQVITGSDGSISLIIPLSGSSAISSNIESSVSIFRNIVSEILNKTESYANINVEVSLLSNIDEKTTLEAVIDVLREFGINIDANSNITALLTAGTEIRPLITIKLPTRKFTIKLVR